MNETIIILLSWASHLSGYPMPDKLPEIEYKKHEFFVENACGGRECKVIGLYKDDGIIYIDERYSDLDDGFSSSLVVHEITHYLQDPDMNPCEREREAYYVQQRYLSEVLLRIDRLMPKQCVS